MKTGQFKSKFDKKYLIVPLVAVALAMSFYFEVPEFLYQDDSEKAIQIAENNEFMSTYRESNDIQEVSTSNLPESTVEELKGSGDLSNSSSNNVYIVDYINNQGMGVSAYVDVKNGEVVDNKYNFKIN